MTRTADFIFDLDGTISDPLDGIHRCMNFALVSQGFDEVPATAVAGLIGLPLDEGFRALVPGRGELPIKALVAKYRERYAEHGYAENRLYDGVADALASLAAGGAVLGVCTSKRVDFAEKILELFGIRALFDFVDGGDIGVRKSSQLAALCAAGRATPQSLMIGDRSVDVAAALDNGLRAAGVLWGYGSEAELREAGAGIVLREAGELAQLAAAP